MDGKLFFSSIDHKQQGHQKRAVDFLQQYINSVVFCDGQDFLASISPTLVYYLKPLTLIENQ